MAAEEPPVKKPVENIEPQKKIEEPVKKPVENIEPPKPVEPVAPISTPAPIAPAPPIMMGGPPPPPMMMGGPPPPPMMGGPPPPPGLNGPPALPGMNGPPMGVGRGLPALPASIKAAQNVNQVKLHNDQKVSVLKFKESIWSDIFNSNVFTDVAEEIGNNLQTSVITAFPKKAANAAAASKEKKDDKPQIKSFVDGTLSFNITLLFGSLKVTKEAFTNAVRTMDCNFKMSIVDAFAKLQKKEKDADPNEPPQHIYPDEESLAQIYAWPEDQMHLLHNCDKLLLSIKDVPRQFQRFFTWSFKRVAESGLSTIIHTMTMLIRAAEALTTSTAFRTFLSSVLSVVNTLSATPIHGFKFGYIEIAKGIKTGDGKSNIVTFALETLLRSSKYSNIVEQIMRDMSVLETASKIDLAEVQKQRNELDEQYKFFIVPEAAIIAKGDVYKADDPFINFYKELDENYKAMSKSIDELPEKINTALLACAKKLDIDEAEIKERPKEFFKTMLTFVNVDIKKPADEFYQKKKDEDIKLKRAAEIAAKKGLIEGMGADITSGTTIALKLGAKEEQAKQVQNNSNKAQQLQQQQPKMQDKVVFGKAK